MSSPVIRDHDNAVVAAVASIGRPTGYGDAPAGALANLLKNPPGPGYYIVYPLPGGMRDGSMSDPYADVELVYQVTCVDRGPEGVRWLTDQLESKFAALQVPDRSVLWVKPTMPSGVFRDEETANPPVFFSTPTFRLATTGS